MEFKFADRLNSLEEGIFARLNEKKEELIKRGRTVYNLSIGTPDFTPDEHVMKAVSQAAMRAENYKYAISELPELIQAMEDFYRKRFGVSLDKEEIMAVYGSQEGLAHIGFALCNPGDTVLVPNPGYPIFEVGPFLAGARMEYYPLLEENEFLPDLDRIPEETARRAKFMVVSYPLNPVCVTAPPEFYERLVRFAEKYNIMIVHDNAYSDIVYDGIKGTSFLAFDGAKEVGVEFYSLSKSFNVTGARISFVVGNKEMVGQFRKLRSQIDYGIFLPVQYGAIAALTGPMDSVAAHCKEYQRRRDVLCGGLRKIGWPVPDSKGSMFAWGPIPAQYGSSEEFCMDLMEKTGVIVVPGSAFGTLGEGYVRFALVKPAAEMEEIVRVIEESGILG
ncbi:aminotransferase class I/II-fold pyridoxal phosphate-dependent enzyme [Anaerolentibacter hominis]|uniref:aminotransferase class I/II-fold pyridoxal phosphate-dependent enzyme n=1 Tax=Anaerolentibacter hominis TaxID=3079009 RepID=UPI0031B8104B